MGYARQDWRLPAAFVRLAHLNLLFREALKCMNPFLATPSGALSVIRKLRQSPGTRANRRSTYVKPGRRKVNGGSTFACLRMGMSRAASFQGARKSWYVANRGTEIQNVHQSDPSSFRCGFQIHVSNRRLKTLLKPSCEGNEKSLLVGFAAIFIPR